MPIARPRAGVSAARRAHLRLRHAALWVLGLATLGGCEPDAPADCTEPGIGRGPCCPLVLPGGERLAGVCIDQRCLRADQPGFDAPCELTADRGPPDAGLGDGTLDGPADSTPTDAHPLDDAATDGPPDGGRDAAPDPCRTVLCDPGERCDPLTGDCRSTRAGIPGGACAADSDCEVGRCLSEEASGGAVPGGYCSVECIADADCGRGHCLEAEGGRRCFESCDDVGRCRVGWVCAGDEGPGCRVDCRVAGCPGQGRCDDRAGLCRPPPIPCPYPCAVGESCEQARCVRQDGSCRTDYHCPSGQICHEAVCVPRPFTACDDDAACGDSQRCVPTDEGAVCLFACAVDDDCPIDRACRADLGACYYSVCGPTADNGDVLGPCGFGTGLDRDGTCLPFSTPGQAEGYCVEAGLAEPGQPCDEQIDGRTPAERAIRCRPGAVCYGDPDDPLDPERDWGARGVCAALCDPDGAGPCPAGTACVDFGEPDDPETPADETRVIGLCLEVQCRVIGEVGCPPGEACRPFGLGDDAGRCGAAGDVGAGGACRSADDCMEAALCVSRGAGTECLPLCDPEEPAGCAGRCYAEAGWGFGVCL